MNTSLLKVSDIIDREYVDIFSFEYFNQMQSIIMPSILNDSSKIVIGSPTGSGKTVLHEAAIIQLLCNKKPSKDIKCVLIAPNKALCQQRTSEWINKFGKYGLLYVMRTYFSMCWNII